MRVIDKIKSSAFFRAVLNLATGTALGQVIGLISTPIISRIYEKAAFGHFAILSSTATIICTISQAGLASAIMLPNNNQRAKEVFTSAFWLQIVIISVFCLGAVAVSPHVRLFDIGLWYPFSVFMLFVYMLITNVLSLLRIYLNRQGQYRTLFWNSIISALSTLLITVPVGFLNQGFWGFWLASVISGLCAIAQMLRKANPFCKINIKGILGTIKEFKEFSLFQLPSNMLSTFSQQLPKQMIDRYCGSSDLGSYSMSERIFGIPSRLVAAPVGQVYFKTASDYFKKGKDLSSFTFSLIKKLMLIGAVPLFILIAFGEQVFSFVLGAQWSQAGKIASILGFNYLFSICAIATSYCRVAIGRQKINFVYSIIQLITIFMALLIGKSVSSDIITIITYFAVANTIITILNLSLNFYCMGKDMGKYLAFSILYIISIGALGYIVRMLIR